MFSSKSSSGLSEPGGSRRNGKSSSGSSSRSKGKAQSDVAGPSSRSIKDEDELEPSRRSSSKKSSRVYSDDEDDSRPDRKSQSTSKTDTPSTSSYKSSSARKDSDRAVDSPKTPTRKSSTRSPPSSNLASTVPNQFPNQAPQDFSLPYRPPSGPSFGAAAEFYGDQGESVHHQPGVRPGTPIIVGTEPHLMAASAVAIPVQDTGHGSAADFYGGTSGSPPPATSVSALASRPQNSTSSQRPSARPSRPSASGSSYGISAAAAGIVAGSATAGYYASTSASPGPSSYATAPNGSQSNTPSQRPSTRPSRQSSSASPYANPATVTSPASGEAASYYDGTLSTEPSTYATVPNSSQSTNSTQRPPARPSKQSGQHSSSILPAAAIGAAGASAAAYAYHQQHHTSSSHQNSQISYSQFHGGRPPVHPLHASTYGASASQSYNDPRRQKGPLGKFSDWWNNYEDVRRMEDYTEYIGVCRYCFGSQDSLIDAPRKHRPTRKRSREFSHRVDKESRYGRPGSPSSSSSSDADGYGKGFISAGLAGVGLAAAASKKSPKQKQRESDDYSVGTGAVEGQMSNNAQRRRSLTDLASERPAAIARRSSVRFQSEEESNSRRRRSSPSSRFGTGSTVIAGAVAATAAGYPLNESSRRDSKSRRNSRYEDTGAVEVDTTRKNYRRRDSSSSSSASSVGIWGKLFSPRSKKEKRKRKGKASISSGELPASSTVSDLAYGVDLPKVSQKRSRRQSRSSSPMNATKAVAGLGTAAALLAAADSRRNKRAEGQSEVFAVREPRNSTLGRQRRQSPAYSRKADRASDDAWEDLSDSDDASSISAESAMAFGANSDASRSSTSFDSMEAQAAQHEGWRYGFDDERRPSQAGRMTDGQRLSDVTSPLTGPSGQAQIPSSRRTSSQLPSATQTPSRRAPLRTVDPIPLFNTPSQFDPTLARPLRSAVKEVPLQQPQPIIRVKPPSPDKFDYLPARRVKTDEDVEAFTGASTSDFAPSKLRRSFTAPVEDDQIRSGRQRSTSESKNDSQQPVTGWTRPSRKGDRLDRDGSVIDPYTTAGFRQPAVESRRVSTQEDRSDTSSRFGKKDRYYAKDAAIASGTAAVAAAAVAAFAGTRELKDRSLSRERSDSSPDQYHSPRERKESGAYRNTSSQRDTTLAAAASKPIKDDFARRQRGETEQLASDFARRKREAAGRQEQVRRPKAKSSESGDHAYARRLQAKEDEQLERGSARQRDESSRIVEQVQQPKSRTSRSRDEDFTRQLRHEDAELENDFRRRQDEAVRRQESIRKPRYETVEPRKPSSSTNGAVVPASDRARENRGAQNAELPGRFIDEAANDKTRELSQDHDHDVASFQPVQPYVQHVVREAGSSKPKIEADEDIFDPDLFMKRRRSSLIKSQAPSPSNVIEATHERDAPIEAFKLDPVHGDYFRSSIGPRTASGSVPVISIINPTPPLSYAGSAIDPHSRSNSPLREVATVDDDQSEDEPPAELPSRRKRRVTWGEDQTSIYQVRTPESIRDEYFAEVPQYESTFRPSSNTKSDSAESKRSSPYQSPRVEPIASPDPPEFSIGPKGDTVEFHREFPMVSSAPDESAKEGVDFPAPSPFTENVINRRPEVLPATAPIPETQSRNVEGEMAMPAETHATMPGSFEAEDDEWPANDSTSDVRPRQNSADSVLSKAGVDDKHEMSVAEAALSAAALAGAAGVIDEWDTNNSKKSSKKSRKRESRDSQVVESADSQMVSDGRAYARRLQAREEEALERARSARAESPSVAHDHTESLADDKESRVSSDSKISKRKSGDASSSKSQEKSNGFFGGLFGKSSSSGEKSKDNDAKKDEDSASTTSKKKRRSKRSNTTDDASIVESFSRRRSDSSSSKPSTKSSDRQDSIDGRRRSSSIPRRLDEEDDSGRRSQVPVKQVNTSARGMEGTANWSILTDTAQDLPLTKPRELQRRGTDGGKDALGITLAASPEQEAALSASPEQRAYLPLSQSIDSLVDLERSNAAAGPTSDSSEGEVPDWYSEVPEMVRLPQSRPESPYSTQYPVSPLQTREVKRVAVASPQGTPTSRTAIPLIFRAPPLSPLPPSDSPMAQSPSVDSPQEPTSPSIKRLPRSTRPASADFKSSREFRPLFLASKYTESPKPDPEETLPSLPSSRTSSVVDSDEGFESAVSSQGSSPNMHARDAHFLDWHETTEPEYLDSQQATPKAVPSFGSTVDVPNLDLSKIEPRGSAAVKSETENPEFAPSFEESNQRTAREAPTTPLMRPRSATSFQRLSDKTTVAAAAIGAVGGALYASTWAKSPEQDLKTTAEDSVMSPSQQRFMERESRSAKPMASHGSSSKEDQEEVFEAARSSKKSKNEKKKKKKDRPLPLQGLETQTPLSADTLPVAADANERDLVEPPLTAQRSSNASIPESGTATTATSLASDATFANSHHESPINVASRELRAEHSALYRPDPQVYTHHESPLNAASRELHPGQSALHGPTAETYTHHESPINVASRELHAEQSALHRSDHTSQQRAEELAPAEVASVEALINRPSIDVGAKKPASIVGEGSMTARSSKDLRNDSSAEVELANQRQVEDEEEEPFAGTLTTAKKSKKAKRGKKAQDQVGSPVLESADEPIPLTDIIKDQSTRTVSSKDLTDIDAEDTLATTQGADEPDALVEAEPEAFSYTTKSGKKGEKGKKSKKDVPEAEIPESVTKNDPPEPASTADDASDDSEVSSEFPTADDQDSSTVRDDQNQVIEAGPDALAWTFKSSKKSKKGKKGRREQEDVDTPPAHIEDDEFKATEEVMTQDLDVPDVNNEWSTNSMSSKKSQGKKGKARLELQTPEELRDEVSTTMPRAFESRETTLEAVDDEWVLPAESKKKKKGKKGRAASGPLADLPEAAKQASCDAVSDPPDVPPTRADAGSNHATSTTHDDGMLVAAGAVTAASGLAAATALARKEPESEDLQRTHAGEFVTDVKSERLAESAERVDIRPARMSEYNDQDDHGDDAEKEVSADHNEDEVGDDQDKRDKASIAKVAEEVASKDVETATTTSPANETMTKASVNETPVEKVPDVDTDADPETSTNNTFEDKDEWAVPVKTSKKDKKKKKKQHSIVEDEPAAEEPKSLEEQTETTSKAPVAVAPEIEAEGAVPTKSSKKDKKKKKQFLALTESPAGSQDAHDSADRDLPSEAPSASAAAPDSADEWSLPTKPSKKDKKNKQRGVSYADLAAEDSSAQALTAELEIDNGDIRDLRPTLSARLNGEPRKETETFVEAYQTPVQAVDAPSAVGQDETPSQEMTEAAATAETTLETPKEPTLIDGNPVDEDKTWNVDQEVLKTPTSETVADESAAGREAQDEWALPALKSKKSKKEKKRASTTFEMSPLVARVKAREPDESTSVEDAPRGQIGGASADGDESSSLSVARFNAREPEGEPENQDETVSNDQTEGTTQDQAGEVLVDRQDTIASTSNAAATPMAPDVNDEWAIPISVKKSKKDKNQKKKGLSMTEALPTESSTQSHAAVVAEIAKDQDPQQPSIDKKDEFIALLTATTEANETIEDMWSLPPSSTKSKKSKKKQRSVTFDEIPTDTSSLQPESHAAEQDTETTKEELSPDQPITQDTEDLWDVTSTKSKKSKKQRQSVSFDETDEEPLSTPANMLTSVAKESAVGPTMPFSNTRVSDAVTAEQSNLEHSDDRATVGETSEAGVSEPTETSTTIDETQSTIDNVSNTARPTAELDDKWALSASRSGKSKKSKVRQRSVVFEKQPSETPIPISDISNDEKVPQTPSIEDSLAETATVAPDDDEWALSNTKPKKSKKKQRAVAFEELPEEVIDYQGAGLLVMEALDGSAAPDIVSDSQEWPGTSKKSKKDKKKKKTSSQAFDTPEPMDDGNKMQAASRQVDKDESDLPKHVQSQAPYPEEPENGFTRPEADFHVNEAIEERNDRDGLDLDQEDDVLALIQNRRPSRTSFSGIDKDSVQDLTFTDAAEQADHPRGEHRPAEPVEDISQRSMTADETTEQHDHHKSSRLRGASPNASTRRSLLVDDHEERTLGLGTTIEEAPKPLTDKPDTRSWTENIPSVDNAEASEEVAHFWHDAEDAPVTDKSRATSGHGASVSADDVASAAHNESKQYSTSREMGDDTPRSQVTAKEAGGEDPSPFDTALAVTAVGAAAAVAPGLSLASQEEGTSACRPLDKKDKKKGKKAQRRSEQTYEEDLSPEPLFSVETHSQQGASKEISMPEADDFESAPVSKKDKKKAKKAKKATWQTEDDDQPQDGQTAEQDFKAEYQSAMQEYIVTPSEADSETSVPIEADPETSIPFEAVSETGAFTRAARETSVPTEAVSEDFDSKPTSKKDKKKAKKTKQASWQMEDDRQPREMAQSSTEQALESEARSMLTEKPDTYGSPFTTEAANDDVESQPTSKKDNKKAKKGKQASRQTADNDTAQQAGALTEPRSELESTSRRTQSDWGVQSIVLAEKASAFEPETFATTDPAAEEDDIWQPTTKKDKKRTKLAKKLENMTPEQLTPAERNVDPSSTDAPVSTVPQDVAIIPSQVVQDDRSTQPASSKDEKHDRLDGKMEALASEHSTPLQQNSKIVASADVDAWPEPSHEQAALGKNVVEDDRDDFASLNMTDNKDTTLKQDSQHDVNDQVAGRYEAMDDRDAQSAAPSAKSKTLRSSAGDPLTELDHDAEEEESQHLSKKDGEKAKKAKRDAARSQVQFHEAEQVQDRAIEEDFKEQVQDRDGQHENLHDREGFEPNSAAPPTDEAGQAIARKRRESESEDEEWEARQTGKKEKKRRVMQEANMDALLSDSAAELSRTEQGHIDDVERQSLRHTGKRTTNDTASEEQARKVPLAVEDLGTANDDRRELETAEPFHMIAASQINEDEAEDERPDFAITKKDKKSKKSKKVSSQANALLQSTAALGAATMVLDTSDAGKDVPAVAGITDDFGWGDVSTSKKNKGKKGKRAVNFATDTEPTLISDAQDVSMGYDDSASRQRAASIPSIEEIIRETEPAMQGNGGAQPSRNINEDTSEETTHPLHAAVEVSHGIHKDGKDSEAAELTVGEPLVPRKASTSDIEEGTVPVVDLPRDVGNRAEMQPTTGGYIPDSEDKVDGIEARTEAEPALESRNPFASSVENKEAGADIELSSATRKKSKKGKVNRRRSETIRDDSGSRSVAEDEPTANVSSPTTGIIQDTSDWIVVRVHHENPINIASKEMHAEQSALHRPEPRTFPTLGVGKTMDLEDDRPPMWRKQSKKEQKNGQNIQSTPFDFGNEEDRPMAPGEDLTITTSPPAIPDASQDDPMLSRKTSRTGSPSQLWGAKSRPSYDENDEPLAARSAHTDDVDFAATLAAGLQDSGFNPSLVIDNPQYHKRTSPPGSASTSRARATTMSPGGSVKRQRPQEGWSSGMLHGAEAREAPQAQEHITGPLDEDPDTSSDDIIAHGLDDAGFERGAVTASTRSAPGAEARQIASSEGLLLLGNASEEQRLTWLEKQTADRQSSRFSEQEDAEERGETTAERPPQVATEHEALASWEKEDEEERKNVIQNYAVEVKQTSSKKKNKDKKSKDRDSLAYVVTASAAAPTAAAAGAAALSREPNSESSTPKGSKKKGKKGKRYQTLDETYIETPKHENELEASRKQMEEDADRASHPWHDSHRVGDENEAIEAYEEKNHQMSMDAANDDAFGLRSQEHIRDSGYQGSQPDTPEAKSFEFEDRQRTRAARPGLSDIPDASPTQFEATRGEPSPVKSTSKDRSSVLFNSPSGQPHNEDSANISRSQTPTREDHLTTPTPEELERGHGVDPLEVKTSHSRAVSGASELEPIHESMGDEQNHGRLQVESARLNAGANWGFISPNSSEIANTRRRYRRSSSIESTEHMRPRSGLSARSRTPGSAVSQRSGTPTLHRSNPSSDLGAEYKRGLAPEDPQRPASSNFNKPSESSRLSSYEPLKGTGRDRRQMSSDRGVYEGYGDVQDSPRSPSRPQSLRKRQSTQLLEFESRIDQLTAENNALRQGRSTSRDLTGPPSQFERTLRARDEQLREKDVEINSIRLSLSTLQEEVSRLAEHNATLKSAHQQFSSNNDERSCILEAERDHAHSQWQGTSRELDQLRDSHSALQAGIGATVSAEIAESMSSKDTEIAKLRSQLTQATNRIRTLQSEIMASKSSTSFLKTKDTAYFASACAQLFIHAQGWVVRFSKFSDMRVCRSLSELRDDTLQDRFDYAILDGTEAEDYLNDRTARRDVFMSVLMALVWEFVFTRYLFGMDREQRQKLKQLEKILAEVGPADAVAQWRATTLTLLSRRPAFAEQRERDTEAVVQEVYRTLSAVLPPPQNLKVQIQDSLRNLMRLAVDLSIDMRTQREEYMMLPPLKPEWDTNGALKEKVPFQAKLMVDASKEDESAEDLARRGATVRLVLFPVVVRRGKDEDDEEVEDTVYRAQVIASREMKRKVRHGLTPGRNASQISMAPSMAAPSAYNGSVGDMV